MNLSQPLLCAWALTVFGVAAEPRKIVVIGQSPDAIRELQSVSPLARLVPVTEQNLMREIVDADAIFGTVSPALIKAGKNLKWVQTYSAGVETFRSDELLSSNIVLTNAKIIQGPNIADHALALLLTMTRQIDRAVLERTKEQWPRGGYDPIELRGKTAVIIGVGGIGTQIAVRAAAFGMRIIGVDPKDVPYVREIEKVVPPDRLDTVLPEADVVFISAPDSPASRYLFGEKQFGLLKRGAYFICVSRGKLYRTEALVAALRAGRLAGVGLDVTDPEPLPSGHALWKFPNVIITPHVAGQSDNVQTRRLALLKENIRRFVAGEKLLNVVDKDKGY